MALPVPAARASPKPAAGSALSQPAAARVSYSRSHADTPRLEAWLAEHEIAERIVAGSALKFALIAEGSADLYPRCGPTMEWDTAAGQALVEAAGGNVTMLDGTPFRYG